MKFIDLTCKNCEIIISQPLKNYLKILYGIRTPYSREGQKKTLQNRKKKNVFPKKIKAIEYVLPRCEYFFSFTSFHYNRVIQQSDFQLYFFTLTIILIQPIDDNRKTLQYLITIKFFDFISLLRQTKILPSCLRDKNKTNNWK